MRVPRAGRRFARGAAAEVSSDVTRESWTDMISGEMPDPGSGYAYVWEYSVRPERVAEFEEAYGPNGLWVQLFRRAEGHVRTELHRDRGNPLRYLTIDYWESAEAWETFRASLSSEFEATDARCEDFTLEERELGRFWPVD